MSFKILKLILIIFILCNYENIGSLRSHNQGNRFVFKDRLLFSCGMSTQNALLTFQWPEWIEPRLQTKLHNRL